MSTAVRAPGLRSPGPAVRGKAGWAAAVLLAAAVLFFCYWRQSHWVPLSSDGASNVLQAWDMLHGNLLLHNWWVSDVSFYTTELPQYMLIEAFSGLGSWVVHAGGAMTYTLLVLLAGWLAMGTARGQEGLARALLAAGLMLAPQLTATQILLLSPDHTGTAVPLLVIWLLIDRLPQRWYVPALVFVLVLWTMAADTVILITFVVPLVLVCMVRALPGTYRRRERPEPRWYGLSLAAAAAAGGGLGSLAPRLMTALGGYSQSPVGTATTSPGQWGHGAWVAFQALLELFGGNVLNHANPAAEIPFIALHLAGVAVVIAGVCVAFARFFRSELLVPAFAVAIVVNMFAYLISPHALDILGAREMAAVLPLGAVLAGRTLGGHLPGAGRLRKWLRPVLAVAAAGYLAALAYGAAQSPVPPANQPLADWLAAHQLTDGLAGYWQANSTTLASGGRVRVSAVAWDTQGALVPRLWESDMSDYDPARHYANFVVADALVPRAVTRVFGPPHRVYHADGHTIMVWNKNLLTELG
jgi:hypothetical protein